MQAGGVQGVTVVIPAYQASRTIAAAVRSALDQTHHPTSVVVINDGSPDANELAAALSSFEHRITFLNQRNRGVSLSRNSAILQANTEWIAFLDADDRYYPQTIERLLDLATVTGSDLVYGNGDVIGSGRSAGRQFMDFCPSEGDVTVEKLTAGECIVLTSSVLARRSVLIEAGLFDASQHQAEDFDLWVRVALNGRKISYTREPVVVRSDDDAGAGSNTQKMLRGEIAVLQRVSARKDIDLVTRSITNRRIAQLQRALRLERLRSLRALTSLRRSAVWCYARHVRVNGRCRYCDRTWDKESREHGRVPLF